MHRNILLAVLLSISFFAKADQSVFTWPSGTELSYEYRSTALVYENRKEVPESTEEHQFFNIYQLKPSSKQNGAIDLYTEIKSFSVQTSDSKRDSYVASFREKINEGAQLILKKFPETFSQSPRGNLTFTLPLSEQEALAQAKFIEREAGEQLLATIEKMVRDEARERGMDVDEDFIYDAVDKLVAPVAMLPKTQSQYFLQKVLARRPAYEVNESLSLLFYIYGLPYEANDAEGWLPPLMAGEQNWDTREYSLVHASEGISELLFTWTLLSDGEEGSGYAKRQCEYQIDFESHLVRQMNCRSEILPAMPGSLIVREFSLTLIPE